MKNFLIALVAFSVFAAPIAEAGNGYKKPKRQTNFERQHNGGYKPHRGRVEKHRRPNNNNHSNNNHHNNYYYDNRRNYNNNNGGGNFYNDPYFWGGVAGGLIGGAIIGNQYYDEPICRYVWTQVYIPGYGYQSREVEVCD
jgi:Ni/Co efflux regulator RcnB